MHLLCSSRFPGSYGFKAKAGDSSDSPYKFLKDQNLLFVNRKMPFLVSFTLEAPPPPDCVVSAVVLCADSGGVERFGPVERCKKHSQEDGGREVHVHALLLPVDTYLTLQ